MTEVVSVPRPLLKELYAHFAKIAEILATLEEQSDKQGLDRMEKRVEGYKKKKYSVVNSPEEIRETLMKD